jgi:hypothetical protein
MRTVLPEPDPAKIAVCLRRNSRSTLAYNLGNFLRALATPEPIKDWSLTSLKEKLIGAKVISHGRYFAFQMAGVAIPRSVFADILRLIAELQSPPVASTEKSVRLSRVPSKTTGDLRHNDRKNYTFDARRTSAKVLGDETPARPRTELPKAIESGSLSAIRRMQDRGTMPWLSRRGERRRNGLLRTLLQLSCQTLIRQEDNAMNSVNYLIPAAIATFSLAGAVGANAEDRFHEPNRYAATNLVSDLAGKAKVRDPILQNAWGVAFSPAPSPFWISDNATGCSTLYDGDGTIVALQVKIPLPGGKVPATACQHANSATKTPAAPTGLVWNATTKFLVPGTKLPAAFIFDTEDGTISAWAGGLTPFDAAVSARG